MKKAISVLSIVSLVSINSVAFAGTNFTYQQATPQNTYGTYTQQPLQYQQNNTLQGNVVMIPSGATMKATLSAPISSETSTVGQTVSMQLNSDFCYNGKTIASAGSTVYGAITEVSKAKRGSRNGKISVKFSQIYTTTGTQIPISAVIKTDDSSGVLVGGTKADVTKEYVKDTSVGAAAGAVSGLVFGALAGGNVGRGAALGTAVGAGGGLVKSVWDKGSDVSIPANATVDLILTQPATVSIPSYQYNPSSYSNEN